MDFQHNLVYKCKMENDLQRDIQHYYRRFQDKDLHILCSNKLDLRGNQNSSYIQVDNQYKDRRSNLEYMYKNRLDFSLDILRLFRRDATHKGLLVANKSLK